MAQLSLDGKIRFSYLINLSHFRKKHTVTVNLHRWSTPPSTSDTRV